MLFSFRGVRSYLQVFTPNKQEQASFSLFLQLVVSLAFLKQMSVWAPSLLEWKPAALWGKVLTLLPFSSSESAETRRGEEAQICVRSSWARSCEALHTFTFGSSTSTFLQRGSRAVPCRAGGPHREVSPQIRVWSEKMLGESTQNCRCCFLCDPETSLCCWGAQTSRRLGDSAMSAEVTHQVGLGLHRIPLKRALHKRNNLTIISQFRNFYLWPG